MGVRQNKLTTKFPQFENPVELLTFYDENFLNEIYKLYPWQVEVLLEFARDRDYESMMDIIRMGIAAANGSGKSQYILAPAIAWMAVAFENSLSYITSSSASQLDTQTERFLDSIATKMNVKHQRDFGGTDVWKIVRRQKIFYPNDSYVDLFATDEPKRAEGKHPLKPGAEFAIFVDEGKSISEDIFRAIERCTGYTRRLDVSSTGECVGHFYNVMTKKELGWWTKKITYKDCPHISPEEFNQQVLKYGINDPLIRSIFFSEFTDVGSNLVIRRETLNVCQEKFSSPVAFSNRRAGLDLAGSGDETVLSIWEGNVQIAQEYGRFYDTAQGVKEIIHWCQSWKLKSDSVWIEYDGFNKGIVDNLADKGWTFNKVLSNSAAIDDKRYGNRITELWFKFKRYVEEGYVKVLNDEVLKNQLATRYYRKQLNRDKIILEPKQEAKAAGRPSPDRADACVFAWASSPSIESFIDNHIKIKPKEAKHIGKKFQNTSDAILFMDDVCYGDQQFFERGNKNKVHINGSLSVLEQTLAKQEI